MAGLGLLLIVGTLRGEWVANALAGATDRLDRLGPLGPAVFMAGYAVATVALVPGSILTLAAGAVFGLGPGTAYAFVGATAGSVLAFLLSRTVARAQVVRKLAGRPVLADIDAAIGREGGRIVFLLRLSPLVPFAVLNYLLGLTPVTLRAYALASVGMLPGTLLYTYAGSIAGSLAQVASGAPAPGPASSVVLVLGLVATVAVVVVVSRIARRALSTTMAGGAG